MNKNKKIFFAFCIIFILILIYIGYDISRRTTFPGGKNNIEEENDLEVPPDSIIILENT